MEWARQNSAQSRACPDLALPSKYGAAGSAVKRWLAGTVAVMVAICLAGCARHTAKLLTPSGNGIPDPAAALKSVTEAWKSWRDTQEVKSRLHDKAQCFIAVTPADKDGGVPVATDAVMCGPLRTMAAETTSWDFTFIDFEDNGSKSSFTLRNPSEPSFQNRPHIEDATWWAPDQSAPLADATVDEPDAPTVDYGQVVTANDVTMPALAPADSIITPDGTYQVKMTTSARVGGPLDRRMVVDGQFVVVNIVREAAYDANYDDLPQKTTLSIEAGQKRYPLEMNPQTFAVAIPLQTAPSPGPDLAALVFTYDGVDQKLDLAGHRVKNDKTQPFYERSAKSSYEDTSTVQGKVFQDGWYSKAEATRVAAVWMPYLDGKGWAKDGSVWLVVSGSIRIDPPKFYSGYDSAEYANNLGIDVSQTTWDAKKPIDTEVGDPDRSHQFNVRFVFEVPSGQVGKTAELKIPVRLTGDRSNDVGSAPEHADLTLNLRLSSR